MATLTRSWFIDYTIADDLTCVTFTIEPKAWRWARMCKDAGRVIFGNILTEDSFADV